MKIGVAGCVAQAEGAEILRRMPLVDLVVGPQSYHRLPEMARGATAQGGGHRFSDRGQVRSAARTQGQPGAHRVSDRAGRLRQVLRLLRGALYPWRRSQSRPATAFWTEARGLVERGVRDITLLGQNVNAYHGAGVSACAAWTLARLIRELAQVEGWRASAIPPATPMTWKMT